MTPETRAARDRLAAFLSHPRVRRDVEPGDPADVIAVITGRLDMPRLYKSDLRLLLAELDRADAETRLRESLRDRPPGQCGKVRPHAAHRWLPSRTALDCPGIPTPAEGATAP